MDQGLDVLRIERIKCTDAGVDFKQEGLGTHSLLRPEGGGRGLG